MPTARQTCPRKATTGLNNCSKLKWSSAFHLPFFSDVLFSSRENIFEWRRWKIPLRAFALAEERKLQAKMLRTLCICPSCRRTYKHLRSNTRNNVLDNCCTALAGTYHADIYFTSQWPRKTLWRSCVYNFKLKLCISFYYILLQSTLNCLQNTTNNKLCLYLSRYYASKLNLKAALSRANPGRTIYPVCSVYLKTAKYIHISKNMKNITKWLRWKLEQSGSTYYAGIHLTLGWPWNSVWILGLGL